MPCSQTLITVPDELNGAWVISILPSGLLETTPVLASGIPPAITLRPRLTGGSSFTLTALSSGMLQTKSGPSNDALPTHVTLSPGDGTIWWLYVDGSGLLYTINLGNAGSQVVVGQLHPNNIAYPPAKQPGGIGTPVTDPKQQLGPTSPNKPDVLFPMNEYTGRFRAGCGHSFNNFEVRKELVSGCDPSALICCPLCLYISRIVTPYDLIHDNVAFAQIIG